MYSVDVKRNFFMPKQKPSVTDQQWVKLEPLWPKHKRSPQGGPKQIGYRDVFEGIIWVLRTGAN